MKARTHNFGYDWILKSIPVNKTVLNEWLKAGYIEKKRLFATEKGTPQGFGVSSVERWNHIADDHEHGFGWIGNPNQQKVSTMEE